MAAPTILLVYNAASLRCGIRNSGDQWATGLRRAGLDVAVWDATFPDAFNASTHRWFPEDVDRYDQVVLLWNPQTLNYYTGAVRWPDRSRSTVVIFEIPPYAACPYLDRFAHVVTYSPTPISTCLLPSLGVVTWVDDLAARHPRPGTPFTLGTSTVRGESLSLLHTLAARHHWRLNLPDGQWRTPEDEIRRLAQSTVNVYWYASQRAEPASAPLMGLASGRPLVINDSPMLQDLQGLPGIGCCTTGEAAEELLIWLAEQWAAGTPIAAPSYPDTWTWPALVRHLCALWHLPYGA